MIRMKNGDNIRTANRHFYENSGIRQDKTQTQHPFLVMTPGKTQMRVDVVYKASELLDLPPTTKVLAQWKGKKRSDFYRFTVKDLNSYITANPPKAKQKI